MNWMKILSIVVVNFIFMLTTILWAKRESKAYRKKLMSEMSSFKECVLKETKDFHGKLCAINGVYPKKIEKPSLLEKTEVG